MTALSLACSNEYRTAQILDTVVHAVPTSSPLTFVFATMIGQTISHTSPLIRPLLVPSHILCSLGAKKKWDFKKTAWISPAVGISIVSLISRVCYDFMPNSLLKGLIYGLHTSAIGILTNTSNGKWARLITLRHALSASIDLSDTLEPLSDTDRTAISKKTEIMASTAFVVTSLALTCFGGFHMITANTLAHVVAATIKVATTHIFARFAEKTPIAPMEGNLATS